MDRDEQILQLVNELNKVSKSFRNGATGIPSIPMLKYPLIKTLVQNMNLKKWEFTDVFINNDEQTFDPRKLELRKERYEELETNIYDGVDDNDLSAFIFTTSYGKEFLAYLGKRLRPDYVWELNYNNEEPEEPESTEGGSDDGGDDMDEEF